MEVDPSRVASLFRGFPMRNKLRTTASAGSRLSNNPAHHASGACEDKAGQRRTAPRQKKAPVESATAVLMRMLVQSGTPAPSPDFGVPIDWQQIEQDIQIILGRLFPD